MGIASLIESMPMNFYIKLLIMNILKYVIAKSKPLKPYKKDKTHSKLFYGFIFMG